MSGGLVLDSDDLTRLSDERRELISMLLPPYGRAARPLNLFQADMPLLLELDCGTHRMLAVFNWSDEPAVVGAPLPEAESYLFDVWGRSDLGVRRDRIHLGLSPHGSRLLVVTPVLQQTRSEGSNRGRPALLFPALRD